MAADMEAVATVVVMEAADMARVDMVAGTAATAVTVVVDMAADMAVDTVVANTVKNRIDAIQKEELCYRKWLKRE